MTLNLKTIMKAVRLLCAIALLSVGFMHKPVVSYAASAPQNQAYQLPDGTFADLCTIHAGDQHKGKRADHGCEACRLSASVLVPEPMLQNGDILRVATEIALSGRVDIIRHRLYPPNSGPRAPPFPLMTI
jgi:hypothetical protein